MAFPNLQSNPNADYVLYLNFNGLDSDNLPKDEVKPLISLVNNYNVDQTPVNTGHYDPILKNLYTQTARSIKDLEDSHPIKLTYNKNLDYLYIPGINDSNGYFGGNWTDEDVTNLWRFVSYKLETFKINVTTNRSIWDGKNSDKRFMTVITFRPSWYTLFGGFSYDDELECKDNGISYKRLLMRDFFKQQGTTLIQQQDANIKTRINFVWDSYILYSVLEKNGTLTSKSAGMGISSVDAMAHHIVHEFGHQKSRFIPVPAGPKGNFINHDGIKGKEYYGGHNRWCAMMGNDVNTTYASRPLGPNELVAGSRNPIFYMEERANLVQWSKGEYKNSNEQQDDINMLAEQFEWVKAPPNSKNLKKSTQLPFPNGLLGMTRNLRHIVKGDLKEQADEPVHIFSDFNLGSTKIPYPGFKKSIAGMIGYSYDFDVLKVLLKAGNYVFDLITPLQSPYYNSFKILRSFTEVDEPPITEDTGGTYPTPENILGKYEKIFYEEDPTILDLQSYTPYPIGAYSITSDEYKGHRVQSLIWEIDVTTLIYIKIFGDKYPYILDPDTGFSEYGSIGKYFFEINNYLDYIRNIDNGNENILNTNTIPACFSQFFTTCTGARHTMRIDGKFINGISLFIKKTLSSNGGTEDQNGAHFLTVPVWMPDGDGSTGHVENIDFLVYGQPIDIDAEEPKGKYYLPVIINGQPKKQEFIVAVAPYL
jgi:hypothetical protein